MQALTAQQSGVPNMNAGYAGATAANKSAGQLYGSAADGFGVLNATQTAGIGNLGSAIGSLAKTGYGPSIVNYMANIGSTGGPSGFDAGGYNAGSNTFHDPTYASDENIKSGTGKKASPDKALAEINATPVQKDWRYDPAKGGPDDGGMPHTGPMAQAVQKHMGNNVAPGGKRIDIASMNGKMLAGMQEITRRLSKLEKRRAA